MCASVMGKKAFLRRKMLLSTSKTFAQGLVLPAGIMKNKNSEKTHVPRPLTFNGLLDTRYMF